MVTVKAPLLRKMHRNQYRLTVALIVTHLAAMGDLLLNPQGHDGPLFTVIDNVAPIYVWAFWQLVAAVLLIFGLYSNWKRTKSGYLLSCVTWTFLGLAFLVSTILYYTSGTYYPPRPSLFPAIFTCLVAYLSWVLMFEPPINPVTIPELVRKK